MRSVPKVITKVLKTIWGNVAEVKRATSSYIDDILVDESVTMTEEIVNHQKKLGLMAKSPDAIERGAALGLNIQRQDGKTCLSPRK